jgi:hypothetical protein
MPFAPCCNPKLAEILSLESMTAPLSGPFNFYYIEISILSKLEADLLKKIRKRRAPFDLLRQSAKLVVTRASFDKYLPRAPQRKALRSRARSCRHAKITQRLRQRNYVIYIEKVVAIERLCDKNHKRT